MDSNEQNRINRIEEFLLDPEKTIFNSIEEFTEAAKILVDFLNNVNFEQLDTIQGEDGYTPVRGVDYFTPEDITAFETFLIERIPVEGVDYPTVQEVQDYISSQVAKIPRIKGDKGAKGEKGQDGKNGSPDTGEDIIKKIRETKKDKLKIGDVRGLTPKISLLNETVDELDNVKKYVEGLKVIIPHVDQSPAGLVTTVNGKTGNVVLDHTDVGADVSGAAAQALSDAKAYTDGKDLLNAEKWRNIPLDAGFSSPSNNDIPIYDNVSGSWKLGQQSGGGAWGSITGTLSDQTDLDTALSGKENTSNKKTDLSSPDNTSYPTTKAVADAIQNSGGGDMLKSTYDPQNKSEAVAFASELPVDVSELNNDAGYITSSAISGKEDTSNKKTTLADNSDTYYPSQKAVKTAVDAKQDTLVSGTNIKTINGTTVLGSGDIVTPNTTYTASDFDIKDLADSTSLRASWTGKQNALVSGTNIKTINSTSLLGSGDITIDKTSVGLGNVDNTSDATKNSATATLENKRIQPRSSTTASGDISPDLAVGNLYQRTAMSAGITINAPTGTPVLGEVLVFMLLDDGTSRAITWDSAYTTRPMGEILPTATTISKQLLVTCQYNGTTWLCLWAEEV